MQKIIPSALRTSLLVALLGVGIICFSKTSFAFSSGTGVEGDPYLVENCNDLFSINGDPSAYFLLTTDLDCSAEGNTMRLTGPGTDFTGNFNGGGHTVTVDIDTSFGTTSLFSSVVGGTISDLRVAGSVNSSTGSSIAGVVASATDGAVITRVVNSAAITGSGSYVGGIVGLLEDSSVSNSYNTGTILGPGILGGIAGQMGGNSSISDSYNRGIVGSAEDAIYHIGGITGWRSGSGSVLTNTFNVGEVLTSQSTFFFGGIWGNDQTGDAGVPSAGLTLNFFDAGRSTRTMCGYANDGSMVAPISGECEAVNTDDLDQQYFKNNSTAQPLSSWNFDTIWETNEGGYPSLQSISNDEGAFNDEYFLGTGTEEDPYIITSCASLQNMNQDKTAYYELNGNIDCSGTASWNEGEGFAPVGDSMVPFSGSFDGKGFVIDGLFMDRGENNVGLFGVIDSGVTIQNVHLENADISGLSNVGAIIGTIGETGDTTRSYLLKSSAKGSVAGGTGVGGLVGAAYSLDLENSYFNGSVSSENFDVGGLAGYTEEIDLLNSYFVGTVASTNNTPYALVGWFAGDAPSILNSFWDADVSGPINATQISDDSAGLSTAAMKSESNFTSANWDFDTIWDIDGVENDGYPFHLPPSDGPGPLDGDGTEESPWRITECMTIAESGFYVLDNSIPDVEGNCINIEADDVEVDGDEYTITGLEEAGLTGIFAEGYDNISIRNIAIDNFEDGVQLWDADGDSQVVNSTFTNMNDDGIEGQGVVGLNISNNTVTTVGDDGIDVGLYGGDENIESSDVTINGNIISETASDGIEVTWTTELMILNNIISESENDGIATEDAQNLTIANNTITDVFSDGIDVDSSSEDSLADIEILENTITTASDLGIEVSNVESGSIENNSIIGTGRDGITLYDSSGVSITENTISSALKGIRIDNSNENTITGNTISNAVVEGFVIPETTFNFIETSPEEAAEATEGELYEDFGDYILTGTDDGYFEYDLPFTLNFKGRNISRISVSTNGSIELLEDGEYCGGGSLVEEAVSFDCEEYGSYLSLLTGDVLFGNFDDLYPDSTENDYVGVFNIDEDTVVVEWFGTTYYDNNTNEYDSETHPIHFQIVLDEDGEFEWNMNTLDYEDYSNNFFTGAYDGVTEDLYIAGFGLDEGGVSFAGDFSGDGEFEETEASPSFTGVYFDAANENTFMGNFITGTTWVINEGEDNVFNDSDSGNTYYFANGAGAWTVYDIKDSNSNGFAETGTDRPFSEAVLGSILWSGDGQDAYPATELRGGKKRIGGYASPAYLAAKGIRLAPTVPTAQTPSLGEKGLCPTDQQLTQNLKAPSRNGFYNSYTGAVVTQAKILQAHLNRLGFNSGPVDGILGPISTGAIQRMQTFLKTAPDGYVGPITRGLLNNSCGVKS